jgi:hypothetical protein
MTSFQPLSLLLRLPEMLHPLQDSWNSQRCLFIIPLIPIQMITK